MTIKQKFNFGPVCEFHFGVTDLTGGSKVIANL